MQTKGFLYFRYVAVHNPIDYKQATNDAQAIRRRLAKYLLPVIFSAVLFNIPKFFEGSYGYHYELVCIFIFKIKDMFVFRQIIRLKSSLIK